MTPAPNTKPLLLFEGEGIATASTSVAVFDDHALFRDMIAKALGVAPGIDVVASGQSTDDAIRISEDLLPDVIILDINMPGDGIRGAQEIKSRFPAIKIIMLTSDDSEHLISASLRAGAAAYVVKGGPVRQLVRTIEEVVKGQSYVSPALAAKLLEPRAFGAPWLTDTSGIPFEITDKEEQILRRLAQGLTNEEIGAGVGLDTETVGKFLTNILMKLQVPEAH